MMPKISTSTNTSTNSTNTSTTILLKKKTQYKQPSMPSLSLSLSPSIHTLLILASLSLITITKAGWIDSDTPHSALKTRSLGVPKSGPPEGPPMNPSNFNNYELVFSDEFNQDGRSFQDGADPKWTALDKNDYTNGALHYYTPNNVKTENGALIIETKAEDTTFVGVNDKTLDSQMYQKHFTSSMLQTWNKFCFTGGIVEAEIQLPGKHNVAGLWPAFWLLGNIARHTYVGSTSHVWPWSSNECMDGDSSRSAQGRQKISGCSNAHYGMEDRFGRGAPEIDIFEVQAGPTPRNQGSFWQTSVGQPFASTSFQVAPGKPENRPSMGNWPDTDQWYDGLTGGEGPNSVLNTLFYGDYNHFKGDASTKDYWSDAISYNHQLNKRHFEGKFRYRVEWELPDEGKEGGKGTDGYIRWYINDQFLLEIDGSGIVGAGLGSTIPTEPMYLIMNTAIAKSWGFPHDGDLKWCPMKNYDCSSKHWENICGFPAGFCDMLSNKTDVPQFKTNWVRVYQNPVDEKQKVGCSTPERPTKTYIEANEGLYKTADDAKPLKPITVGKGSCSLDAHDHGNATTTANNQQTCGGPTQGICTPSKTCECRKGWTGPHCLVEVAFDPIIWEREDNFDDLEFTWPKMSIKGIWTGLLVLAVGLVLLAVPLIQRRMDGWKPIQQF